MFAVPLGHGTLAPKEDLPIPETWFAWGAAIVLILSFIGLSIAWVKPRFEEDRWKAFGGFSRVLVNRVTQVLAGALGVFLLGVVVWSGLYGTENERANFSVTFVFVTFWVCVPVVSILFGDVFRAFNPWRAIGRVFGGLFGLIAGRIGARAARLSGEARALARGGGARRFPLARARVRRCHSNRW